MTFIYFSFSEECSTKGGTNAGSCASGFGVCCTCKLFRDVIGIFNVRSPTYVLLWAQKRNSHHIFRETLGVFPKIIGCQNACSQIDGCHGTCANVAPVIVITAAEFHSLNTTTLETLCIILLKSFKF